MEFKTSRPISCETNVPKLETLHVHGSDLKSNHITRLVLSCSENRRSFAHPSIKRIIAWNGHNMGLFLDQSIETSHGKIHHMERTQKSVCWERKTFILEDKFVRNKQELEEVEEV